MTLALTQAVCRNRQLWPQAEALCCGERRRDWTQVADRVARLAAGLRAHGMREGDRVGMLALNSDRYVEYYYAVWWGGGAVNPVNVRWSAHEIAYSLDDCDTRILFVDDAFLPMLDKLREKSRSLRTLVYIGDSEVPAGMLSYESLIRDHAPIEDAGRNDGDLAGVFYTGGTTGFPKGVMLSHGNLLSNAMICLMRSPFTVEDHGLLVTPAFHIAGAGMIVRWVLSGSAQTILPSFDAQAVLDAIVRDRVTATFLVPTMLQMVLDHPGSEEYDLSCLGTVVYAGSSISEALLERVLHRLPTSRFFQPFGQTELSPCVTYLTPEYHTPEGRKLGKLRSVGIALPACDVRIVNEDGAELPRGNVGEIVARGPGVMLGYWNKPEETAHALRDGWLHTGDAGYMDEDGFVFIVDRVKDMIISGGENVYSAEVEQALAQHPAVATCAVIGIPSERWGESVHAVVVLRPGHAATAETLTAHCRELIAAYKCPRSYDFREQLPLSGVGKVLKYELRKQYWERSNATA